MNKKCLASRNFFFFLNAFLRSFSTVQLGKYLLKWTKWPKWNEYGEVGRCSNLAVKFYKNGVE